MSDRIRCPTCQTSYPLPARARNQLVRCPRCRTRFRATFAPELGPAGDGASPTYALAPDEAGAGHSPTEGEAPLRERVPTVWMDPQSLARWDPLSVAREAEPAAAAGPPSAGRAAGDPRAAEATCHEPSVGDPGPAPASGAEGYGLVGPGGGAEPTRIGRFELKEALGQGAFGRVYLAYDPLLERRVALKIPKIRPGDARRGQAERVLLEARSAARLRHPNIVAVYEIGRTEREFYIASEFIEGAPLSERLASQPPGWRKSIRWVGELARALAYAHIEGVVHRDIKPANILLDARDRPRLTDFGLAKRSGEQAEGAGAIVGTPAYMSPEQARGDAAVGPATDQYSLGAVLYEMLTGRRPFDGPTDAVLEQVREQHPPPPRLLNRRIPRNLEAVCLKAMAKDPGRRYPDLLEFAQDLDRSLAGEPVRARPMLRMNPVELIWGACRRRPAMATAVVLCLSLATLLAFERLRSGYDRRRALEEQGRLQAKLGETDRDLISARASLDNLARRAGQTRGQLDHAHGMRLIERRTDPVRGLFLLARAAAEGRAQGDLALEVAARADLSAATAELPAVRLLIDPGRGLLGLGPDGRFAATRAEDDPAILLLDTRTGRPVGEPLRHPGPEARVARIAFGPRGDVALTFAPDGTAQLWAVPDGRAIGPPLDVRGTGPGVESVEPFAAFSPDGGSVALTFDRFTIHRWDTRTGAAPGPPLGHGAKIEALSFRDDGSILVTRDADGLSRRRDAITGEPVGVPEIRRDRIAALAPAPDGRTVLVVGAPDRQGSEAVRAQVRDVATGEPLGEPFPYAPEAARLVVGSEGRVEARLSSRGISLWDTTTGRLIGAPISARGDAYFGPVLADPAGRRLLTIEGGKAARLWDVATARPVAELRATEDTPSPDRPSDEDSIRAARFGPGGDRLLTVSRRGVVRFWDPSDGRRVGTSTGADRPPGSGDRLFLDHGREVARWSPDGRTVVILDPSGTARIWDAREGAPRGTPLEHDGAILAVEFRPDGRAILTRSGRAVRIWSDEGRPLSPPIEAGEGSFRAAVFCDGGGRVAIARGDGTAALWDVAGACALDTPLAEAKGISEVFSGPGASTLLTWAASRRQLQLWDARTGRPVGDAIDLGDGGASSVSVRFRDDGQRLLVQDSAAPRLLAVGPRGLVPLAEVEGWAAEFFWGGRALAAVSGEASTLYETDHGRAVGRLSRRGRRDVYHGAEGLAGVVVGPEGRWLSAVRRDVNSRDTGPVVSDFWVARPDGPFAFTPAQLLLGPDADSPTTPAAPVPGMLRAVPGLGRLFEPRDLDSLVTRSDGPHHPFLGALTVVAAPVDGPGAVLVRDEAASPPVLRLVDASTGRALGPDLPRPGDLERVALGPDGRTAILATPADRHVAGLAARPNARLWDAATGRPIGEPFASSRESFSADGRLLLTQRPDDFLELRDARDGRPIGLPLPSSGRLHDFASDGRTLAGSTGRAIALRRPARLPRLAEALNGSDLRRIVFLPSGNALVTAADRSDVVLNLETGAVLRRDEPVEGSLSVRAWGPDGRMVVRGSFRPRVGPESRLIDPSTGESRALPGLPDDAVLAFRRDGSALLVASRESVGLYDLEAGRMVGPPPGLPAGASIRILRTSASWSDWSSVAFEKLTISRGASGPDAPSARAWCSVTGRFLEPIPAGEGRAEPVAVSPDGRVVALAEPGGDAVRLWDLEAGRMLRSAPSEPWGDRVLVIEPDSGRPTAIAFSDDGRFVALGTDGGRVQVWAVGLQVPCGPAWRLPDRVEGLAFSPDGELLAADGPGYLRLSRVPAALPADVKALDRFVQLATGLRYDEKGELVPLDAASWSRLADELGLSR